MRGVRCCPRPCRHPRDRIPRRADRTSHGRHATSGGCVLPPSGRDSKWRRSLGVRCVRLVIAQAPPHHNPDVSNRQRTAQPPAQQGVGPLLRLVMVPDYAACHVLIARATREVGVATSGGQPPRSPIPTARKARLRERSPAPSRSPPSAAPVRATGSASRPHGRREVTAHGLAQVRAGRPLRAHSRAPSTCDPESSSMRRRSRSANASTSASGSASNSSRSRVAWMRACCSAPARSPAASSACMRRSATWLARSAEEQTTLPSLKSEHAVPGRRRDGRCTGLDGGREPPVHGAIRLPPLSARDAHTDSLAPTGRGSRPPSRASTRARPPR
jgi:hypothetical protein